MNKGKIYDYVMHTPKNTNPSVLASLLNEPTSWNDLVDKPFYAETKTEKKECVLKTTRVSSEGRYYGEGTNLEIAQAVYADYSKAIVKVQGEEYIIKYTTSEGADSRYYDIIDKNSGECLGGSAFLLFSAGDSGPTGEIQFYNIPVNKEGAGEDIIISIPVTNETIKTIDPKFLLPTVTLYCDNYNPDIAGPTDAYHSDGSQLTEDEALDLYTRWIKGETRILINIETPNGRANLSEVIHMSKSPFDISVAVVIEGKLASIYIGPYWSN